MERNPVSAELAAAAAGADLGEALWERLKSTAVEAMGRAYAPYSGFPVGAAALTDDGRIVSGCNVENAAYGVVLCAECSMVSELFATGGGTLRAFVCVDGRESLLAPCGRCRQLLQEHAGPRFQARLAIGTLSLGELLPGAFTPDTLASVAGAAPTTDTDPAGDGRTPKE